MILKLLYKWKDVWKVACDLLHLVCYCNIQNTLINWVIFNYLGILTLFYYKLKGENIMYRFSTLNSTVLHKSSFFKSG